MKQSGFGIASLVLGIVSILLACVGIGIFPAILGIIFAIIGFVVKDRKRGTAIAGLICSIVGVIIFLFVFLVADSIFSDDDKEVAQKVETVAQSEAGTDSESANADDSNEEATEVDNSFNVGEVVETSDFRISFLSAEEYVSDNQFIQPKEGYVYYKMDFEFENISDSDKSVSSMINWNCYADGYKADQTWIGDDNGLDASLSAGKKTKGAVFFEIPKDAQSIELEYETNFWTEDKVIFICK